MIFVFTGSFGGESIKSPTDLIRCGFIPEISNRVDFFLHLERPSKEDLSKLTASGEYYDSAIEYARKQSIQVSFDQDFKMRLATEAYQMGGNYRSVSYLFNNVVYGKIAELAICGSKSHVFSSDDLEKKDD